MTQPDLRRAVVRRTARLSSVLLAVGVLLAPGAALADVPEGWSDPDPVEPIHALLVFVVGPIALFVVIYLLASLPHLVGRAQAAPSVTDPEPALPAGEGGLDALLGPRDDEPAALEASPERD